MFNSIRYSVCNRVLRKYKAHRRTKNLLAFEAIKTVLIAFEIPDEASWVEANQCVSLLEKDGKQVWIIAVIPANAESNFVFSHNRTFIVRVKNDFSLWGLPRPEILSSIMHSSFDIFVDATGTPNFFTQLIALRSHVDYRIAYDRPVHKQIAAERHVFRNSDVFDLVIRGDEAIDLNKFMQDMIEYIKIIAK